MPDDRAHVTLPPDLLADIAEGIGCAEELWKAVVRHDHLERRPVRLLATEGYEVWVIGWMPTQSVELHDHGGCAGALKIVEGELAEQVLAGDRLVRHRLRAGDLRMLPPDTVHRVANDRLEPATSIHVYSPPLTGMTGFDPSTLRPVEVSPVAEEPPVLPASVLSLLAGV